MIYIYRDEGVCQTSFLLLNRLFSFMGYRAKQITSTEIKKNIWPKKAKLLVMPGGRDLPYLKNLGHEGSFSIKNFVFNGGNFLGICAGAYFACNFIEFEKNGSLEVIGERPLKFFPYKGIGPIFGNNTFKYNSFAGAKAVKIEFTNQKRMTFFYNGGPYFEKLPDSIVAYYTDFPNTPVAIVQTQVGKGKALLSGVHFEYFYDDLDLNDAYLKRISNKMTQNKKAQLSRVCEILKPLI